MNFFDTYYNSNNMWGSRGAYILTRFLKSAFTGPVRPTPGTARNYYEPNADAGKGFDENLFLSGKPFDLNQTWPGNPPIDIEIHNLALPKELTGQEDKIVLAGINPGNLTDSGSPPSFNTLGPPIGRSSPYQIYGGGGARVVRVSIPLHRDMFDYQLNISGSKEIADIYEQMKRNQEAWIRLQNEIAQAKRKAEQSKDDPMIPGDLYSPLPTYEYEQYVATYRGAINAAKRLAEETTLKLFWDTINWFRAIQYPIYTKEGGIIAPRAFMRIGKFLQIIGWPNVSITYENIYAAGYPVKVNVEFQITETMQRAYDQSDIRTNRSKLDSIGMNCVEWK